ncbi:MAG: nicotinate-nucleotide adenylyltransferase [Clostridiaceae bacterium]|nr:nicotinate-nucleotide adenylyltransferase [Clostridiaceae bacterium]
MERQYRRIGISGGTFDPIHYGHLVIAEEIRETMGLDKVIFIPSSSPPHKRNLKVTQAIHRFNMVNLAIATNPYFEVSSIELEREGYSYTIDTLTQLKQVYGQYTTLFFMTGADVIPELVTWRNFENLFTLCEFVAVLRPGFKKESLLEEIEYYKKNYKAKIHVVDVPLIGISSTIIRNRVEKGKSIKYLVPESVEKYIKDNVLYDFDSDKNTHSASKC